jgi:hypothetical protein
LENERIESALRCTVCHGRRSDVTHQTAAFSFPITLFVYFASALAGSAFAARAQFPEEYCIKGYSCRRELLRQDTYTEGHRSAPLRETQSEPLKCNKDVQRAIREKVVIFLNIFVV